MLAIKPDNSAVMLAKGDFSKDIPAIWLETAEGTAPTMNLHTWTVLGLPTWGATEVYVCVERHIERPVRIRSGSCEKCVVGTWMNAGAQLMLGDSVELEKIELKWGNV